MPTKQHLREALLFCFNLKKSGAEGHRLLCEAYGEHAPSIKTCEVKFEDAELEALLDQDSCQTQEKLAETLGVT